MGRTNTTSCLLLKYSGALITMVIKRDFLIQIKLFIVDWSPTATRALNFVNFHINNTIMFVPA